MDEWSEDHTWSAIHAERDRLASDLERLDDRQWSSLSECADWTVEDVVAHLTAAASTNRWRWLRSVVGARFRFDVHNARRLADHRGPDPAGTLARFRSACPLRVQPARPTWAWLGEVIVHGADIRVPLGIDSLPVQETVDYLAGRFATQSFTVPSKKIATGLTLISTDGSFRHGSGPQVTGRSIDLVRAMAGRPAATERLEGDGVPILAQRLSDLAGTERA